MVGVFDVKKLLDRNHPMETPHLVWPGMTEEPITVEDVLKAITDKQFAPTPKDHCALTPELIRKHHIGRLAFLMENGWKEPTPLNINFRREWMFLDGNHRLCVTSMQNKPSIQGSYKPGDKDLIAPFLFA